jgi:ubiquinone/menaquinone biosynthesis C-methylase UbiE
MVQFHFVEDYEKHVAALLASHPIDEAMSLAVGGQYDEIGAAQAELLCRLGLRSGMSVVDIGCGSGRTAKHLGRLLPQLNYLGTDVVQSLLDYAASQSPPGYRFLLHQQLNIHAPDATVDMVVAFSVFTHLLHEETFAYLEDARRVLRPAGQVIFSFLEFAQPDHWTVFRDMLHHQRNGTRTHLNMFLERPAIEAFAQALGLRVEVFMFGPPLGQSIALLRKPLIR